MLDGIYVSSFYYLLSPATDCNLGNIEFSLIFLLNLDISFIISLDVWRENGLIIFILDDAFLSIIFGKCNFYIEL